METNLTYSRLLGTRQIGIYRGRNEDIIFDWRNDGRRQNGGKPAVEKGFAEQCFS